MKRLALLQQDHILPNIVAGLITGIVTLTYSVSYAALIFSGGLSNYLPIGIGSALICSVLSSIVVALSSDFPFVVVGPDPNSSVILAVIAGDIATRLQFPNPEQQMFPTVWAAVVLSTIAAGTFLFLLGQLRLGRWVRFIPYPVIGGFLAGTGWLLTRGSFKVMAGLYLDWSEIPRLVQFETFLHWFLGCCFALLLLGILRRYKHFMTLPAVLLGATIIFHLGLRLTNTSLYAARIQQWLFAPFPNDQLTKIWDFSALTRVNWSVLLQQSGTLVALMTVVVITILLNASSLEIATQTDVDLDHELKVSGIANLLTGLSGGMVGCLTFNRSLLGYKAGASSPLATLTLGTLCGAVFLFGSSFLVYLPKPILGGLLLYLGLSLLTEWVYGVWFKLPKSDCFIVLLILVVIAVSGFIVGIGVGILVAAILFVVNYSRIDVAKHILSAVARRSNVQRSLQQERLLREQGSQIYIVELQNFIFFGTANTLLNQIRQRVSNPELQKLRFLVLDFRLVNGVDSSAALSFVKLRQTTDKNQTNLVFTALQPAVAKLLKKSSALATDTSYCQVFPDLDRGLEWCETQILNLELATDTKVPNLAEQITQLFLSIEQVSEFISYLEQRQLLAGQYLFRQGDPADGLYFLESGQVSVLLELPNNQTKRLRTFNSGTILGEIGLYGNAPRSASVQADQLSDLYHLSIKAFNRMEIEAPLLAIAFHKFVVGLLAERLQNREEELKSLL